MIQLFLVLIEEEEESDTGFTCADCLINCEGDDEA